jgi:hypothetical protein
MTQISASVLDVSHDTTQLASGRIIKVTNGSPALSESYEGVQK